MFGILLFFLLMQLLGSEGNEKENDKQEEREYVMRSKKKWLGDILEGIVFGK